MKKAHPEVNAIDLLKGIKRNLERGKDYDDFILDEKIQKKFILSLFISSVTTLMPH